MREGLIRTRLQRFTEYGAFDEGMTKFVPYPSFILSRLSALTFLFRLLLSLLHVLSIVFDRHWLYVLIREHEIDTFKLHSHLGIIAEVGMDIAVDVHLLLKDCVISGNEEQ